MFPGIKSSSNGCLPQIKAGGPVNDINFLLQIVGFGYSSVFHADNEYCSLNEMKNGMKIFVHILNKFNQ